MTDELIEELVAAAKEAADNAYAPYSKYPVGAAVLTSGNFIFKGCNVENISFGATVCAERVAIVKAVSEGYTDIVAIAVYHAGAALPYPCGMCRQMLTEFTRYAAVIISNGEVTEVTDIKQLMPNTFETDEIA